MPVEVARWLAELRADPVLQARVDELADRNTAGTITPEELAEYDAYLRMAETVAFLQARARKAANDAADAPASRRSMPSERSGE